MMRRRIFLRMGLSVLFMSLVLGGNALARETYEVQHGDTLSGIAGKTGVTPNALKAANYLKGSILKANQVLDIPSAKIKKISKLKPSPVLYGEVYVVKKGDTLAGIARKTGVPVTELREINRLPGNTLKIGRKLALKKRPESDERTELQVENTTNEPMLEVTDAGVLTAKQAWADIERRRRDNEALLGKWSSPEEPKLLVQAAMGFLGAPYRLGGFSAKGIDCSGLVKKSYQFFDIDLPRTAFEQSRVGMRVARNELTEGDLLFFNTRRKFGHVGIYIGNNEFVHAASRNKGVRVDTLDTPYYNKRFIRAVRLKGSDDGL